MAAQTSNLTVNVALAVRKAASLLLSVVLFGNTLTPMHAAGAVLVFGGTLLYRDAPPPAKRKAE
jgi:solute carrier family 35 (UDP-xylose/UDP-N-acetylglucosamine transporter), member B4